MTCGTDPFYDEFYIYGGLWADTDHGQEKLMPSLRHCGVVSESAFDYLLNPDDSGADYEWRAYGRLPVGAQQWIRVKQAVIDSGGPGDIVCGGK